MPIALFCYPGFNTINLVTSVAAKYGHALKLMRIDPMRVAKHAKDKLDQQEVNDLIENTLLDLTNIRMNDVHIEWAKVENMVHFTNVPKQ